MRRNWKPSDYLALYASCAIVLVALIVAFVVADCRAKSEPQPIILEKPDLSSESVNALANEINVINNEQSAISQRVDDMHETQQLMLKAMLDQAAPVRHKRRGR